ncbi:glycosyltransferase family 2 protein [Paenibacillus polymyxa]|jgi:GT2 family glycosyltransferase|uniref:glycosyltransferase family 2 protein n=1 Tax=Paenibacillus polymyxa TaxID=1406 RepID=UPI0015804F44|nr:glycosyltransferase family 2 protein [Paenibacillus polymyxa]MBY0022423.1 glycosyltransferase family 2 protein [Paenibacillus polymyxa]MBY0058266.1 glycosyltransferase family 2 protein [Paenibacillus polymyxa]MBY0068879.1 glycosyltransferase family 2 protein [Paenibacillus polymyxa]MBY0079446.1 glycosyltransferase family 2 protein [Paenibacillus polymyxa]MBZ6444038.1 glycosyltransferase family 2 protein [Paenibacillus polymyxa]
MSYKISIVIVNYNGKKYIKNLFDSLSKMDSTGLTYEIVFVDNNSTDDSIQFLTESYREVFPNLKILETKKNLGFAGGNNYGVKHSEGEYVVFLNNDTAVEKNWLLEMYTFFSAQENIGIAASKLIFFHDFIKVQVKTQDKIIISSNVQINDVYQKVDVKFTKNLLYMDNELTCFGHTVFYLPLIHGVSEYSIDLQIIKEHDQTTDFIIIGENSYSLHEKIILDEDFISNNKVTLIQNAGSGVDEGFNGFDQGFCEEDQGQYDKAREIDSCCGAAMMIRRDLFIEVGGFDSKFFMYYEDTDLSYRVKKKGLQLLFCPTALVRHVHTGSSQEWSPFFVFHVYRNKLLFISKNFKFKIFAKQFLWYVAHVIKEVFFTKQKTSLKKAKLKALFAVIKISPSYWLKKKMR